MENIIGVERNLKNYRVFYDMDEFITALSRVPIVWSWGARKWTNINNKMLRFRVSAYRHKGYIYIAVNGSDLFDIWLTNLKGNIKKQFADIHIEDVINVIDEEIEKISSYSY